MCDTFVATPGFTASGRMIFGKNSDREPNEAQQLVRYPARECQEKELRCTQIAIPQAASIYEVILSKPFQMWGAEMGANEHGLTIGNEAVFTRVRIAKKNDGLTGMDMIRLALERKRTAADALSYITDLIEEYGQDACGGYTDRGFFYHNSFIMADPEEAYVLESAGRHWVAAKVQGFRSISNGLTIDADYDYCSKGVIDYARKQGWLPAGREFSFREAFSDGFFTYFSKCKVRQARSTAGGSARTGRFQLSDALQILRSHGEIDPNNFDPATGDMGHLCLHASGLTTPSQTTGSLAAELRPDGRSSFWFTGSAAPCLSVYKPVFCPGDNLIESEFAAPGPRPDHSLWWRHEQLHRLALRDYRTVSGILDRERQDLENDFQRQELLYLKKKARTRELSAFSRECFERADEALGRWLTTARAAQPQRRGFTPLYSLYRMRTDAAVDFEATAAK
ncbi:MAG: C69 family dipeptidase [Leptospirales bacterium]|nr:C69 family dipeptidase [Leptospirales bacterium]